MFAVKPRNILSVYFTAGFPTLTATQALLKTVEKAGIDCVEVGIPFCDPLVDGPTIQAANQQALANGMSLALLLQQLAEVRKDISIPIILMGYLNPVLKYGVERFCHDAKQAGVDGVILPDLPLSLYQREYKSFFTKHALPIIFLITPRTPFARIRQLDAESSGFLYMVGRHATTGTAQAAAYDDTFFTTLQEKGLKNPLLMGFGIRNRADIEQAWRRAHGAVIGSAFLQALKGNVQESAQNFICQLTKT